MLGDWCLLFVSWGVLEFIAILPLDVFLGFSFLFWNFFQVSTYTIDLAMELNVV